MSEEAIRAELAAISDKLDGIAAEVRRTVENNRDSHKDIYDRLSKLETGFSKMDITSRAVFFIAGTALSIILQKVL